MAMKTAWVWTLRAGLGWLAVAGVAHAQAPAAPPPPAQLPAPPQDGAAARLPSAARFGVVTGEQVNLRAGPSIAYEAVGQLERGSRVEILGSSFGWYCVRPERPVPAFVSAALLELREGGVALARKDRVNVRARPDLRSSVIAQLQQGQLVRVSEAGPEWVRIEAPPGARLYVHGELLALEDTPPTAAAPARAGAAGDAPAGEAGRAPAPSPAASPEPSASPAELLARANALYLAELDKPDLDAMDFGPALQLFERAREQAQLAAVREAAEAGIRRVQIALRLQEDYRRRMRRLEEALKP
ncbi:MAG: hypothetical protein KatS3mg102_1211 [Planctomycetota bacterium]|nr:MAG: hypothetical protein KatS3mg102_1211 [Planctomycetota bacterium]